MACRSGCRTQDHASYAQCCQDASIGAWMVAQSKGFDQATQRRWDGELGEYKALRKQGIQPDGTTRPHLEKAKMMSDKVGAAYGTDFNAASPMGD